MPADLPGRAQALNPELIYVGESQRPLEGPAHHGLVRAVERVVHVAAARPA
jgi:hypothetical protein